MQKHNKSKQTRYSTVAFVMPIALAGMTLMPQGIKAVPLRSGLTVEQTAIEPNETFAVKNVAQINPHTIEVNYTDGRQLTVDFYGENIMSLISNKKREVVS